MNWFAGSAGDAMVTELLYERFGERYEVLCLPDFNVPKWYLAEQMFLLFFLMSLAGPGEAVSWCEAKHISFWSSEIAC